ncbi:uncharacterized protein METZ01_LOCUS401087 [marine metagenome]|uniref:Uncharacterized protein n=1 Tax=marine metagenome TaxID=408172 RepID=A0A382VP15_9ZZZZ
MGIGIAQPEYVTTNAAKSKQSYIYFIVNIDCLENLIDIK